MGERRRTCPAFFVDAFRRVGNKPLLFDRKGEVPLGDLLRDAAAAAEGLRRLGVEPGDRVGFYADNSRRWILTDLAIQCAQAVSVPRGTDTPPEDMAEIFAHAEVGVVFVHAAKQKQALEALRDRIPTMQAIVCLDPSGADGETVDGLVEAGADGPDFEACAEKVQPDDLATIIYTSGTTGRPKGVMLTQSNFGHQIDVIPGLLHMVDGERFLSILPPWHIFERTVEYVALCAGCELVYTDRRRFKEDLAKWSPTFVPSVPRIWETVFDTIQKKVRQAPALRRAIFRGAYAAARTKTKARARMRGQQLRVKKPRGAGLLVDGVARLGASLVFLLTWLPAALGNVLVFSKLRQVTGGRLRGAVSGGGLMPPHVDAFFGAIGVPILVGYGLTETSPVISVRRAERNILGTIGTVVPEVEVQVRHVDTGAVCAPGERGVIFTRGPHIMRGYYKDEALTAQVIDDDGWFDTGDLGFLTEEGDICFVGRAKETIVLKGGENVEPSEVETALLSSTLIEQAIVVGQDRKTLAALVVPDPDALKASLHLEQKPSYGDLAHNEEVRRAIRDECRERTSGMRPYERIMRIALLPEVLDAENGCLTQTLKPKRHVIVERFKREIEEAYEQ
ncbi:MAG: long-chain fatty acid--CoA ligase [Planctomycetota bacterium]|nr:long-chain fatty acid--CoA ligase [Planctomycetota bacterium]